MNKKGFTISELLMVFVIATIIAVIILPLINKSRRKMQRVQCAHNLQELSRAMFIYAKEHSGEFPPDIKTLYDEKYVSDQGLLDCPANKKQGTLEKPEYIYAQGLSVKRYSREPLVQDKKTNHFGLEKNMLYVNGDIVWAEE